jgi:hypothetical protein
MLARRALASWAEYRKAAQGLTVHGERKIEKEEKEERGELPSRGAAVWKLYTLV